MLSAPSGIFGYINYLVEKDRKFIIDTLVNGMILFLSEAVSRAVLRAAGGSGI